MAGARRASRRRYVLLLVVLTALTLITLDSRNGRRGPLGAMGRVAHTIVSPIERGVDDVARPVSDWWHGVTDAGHVKAENRKLRQQLDALVGKERDAAAALADDAMLKDSLHLQNILKVKNVTALIVNRDPGNFDPTLTIDRGTESGIAVEMAVVAPTGFVGKVIEAWRGGAKIRVLTDPLLQVGVQSPGHPGSPASTSTASGQRGSKQLAAVFTDPGVKLLVGDMLRTSPLSDVFPPGIPIGTVRTATEQPGDTGVDVTIDPYVDIGALQFLTVLLWVKGEEPQVYITTTTTTSTTTTTTTPAGSGAVTSTTRGP